jgi:hypothetical protein
MSMGVYIKGMEMPKNCAECPLKEYMICEGNNPPTICVNGYVNEIPKRGIISDCPLVHVPPHGRLGDLDELKERATKRLYASNHGSMAEAYYAALIDLIDSAPTIIPAEEGET